MPASERASPLFVKTLVAGASITPSNGLQTPARNARLEKSPSQIDWEKLLPNGLYFVKRNLRVSRYYRQIVFDSLSDNESVKWILVDVWQYF